MSPSRRAIRLAERKREPRCLVSSAPLPLSGQAEVNRRTCHVLVSALSAGLHRSPLEASYLGGAEPSWTKIQSSRSDATRPRRIAPPFGPVFQPIELWPRLERQPSKPARASSDKPLSRSTSSRFGLSGLVCSGGLCLCLAGLGEVRRGTARRPTLRAAS